MFSESLRALTQVMGVTCDLWNNLLMFVPLLCSLALREVLRAPSDMSVLQRPRQVSRADVERCSHCISV